ncbi:unnamed protein product, partial [Meganyctiphanes norvegica]
LAMNFFITLKVRWIGDIAGLLEENIRDKTSKRTKLIFIILEDAPQLILASMFIINSVITDDNAEFYVGIQMLHIWSLLGVWSSSASIALALTLSKRSSTCKPSFIQFATTVVSVGTRALVCASYAARVAGFLPLTWPLVLPPVTAIGLFMIEMIFFFIYEFVVDCCQYYMNKKSKICEWVTKYNYNDFAVLIRKKSKKFVICIVSLSFESNSVQCLITSYTYLGLAIAINAASLSAWNTTPGVPNLTQTTFNVIQYLAIASFLLNLLIVQWEGKYKVRCLAYSLIFLMVMGSIYYSAKNDFEYFYSYYDYLKQYYDKNTVHNALLSLRNAFFISVIMASINLIILIISIIKSRRDWLAKITLPWARDHGE